MPGRRNIIPTERFTIKIPRDVKGQLDLHLWSEVEQRIPKGAYQRFFVYLITQYLKENSK